MTHLRIEQNNIQENVSSAVIEKLYELVTSGTLDNSSYLAGNLYTPATYQEYIDTLTDQNNSKLDLTITAGVTYMIFQDPEVENKLKEYVGDGIGVIASRFQAMTQLPNGFMSGSDWINLFIRDTSLIKFNELVLATNCTTLGDTAFETCSNLEEINISNITSVGNDCFQNCRKCVFNGTLSNLQSIGSQAFQLCYELTGNLVLPHVSSMGNNAFEACKISSVNLTGSTITTIPNSAFASISTLTTATVPTSVTEIVWRAFGDDSALTTVSGLSNVTIIGGHAFESCSNLTTVDIDWTKVTTIGTEAFSRCYNLSGIVNLSSATSLGSYAFDQTSITSLSIGSSITNIPDRFCSYDTHLTSVTIPSTVTSIGSSAFDGCTSLTSFDFTNIDEISSFSFRNTGITIVNLNNTITTIRSYAFDNTPVQYLHVPGNVTTLGDFVCTNYSCHYKIDEGITSIGNNTFRGNRLILPSTITSIGNLAYGPNTQEFIVIKATTPPTYPSNCFQSNFNYAIYVPDASVAAYKAQPGGNGGYTAWTDRVKSFTDFANDYPGISLNGTGYATDPV